MRVSYEAIIAQLTQRLGEKEYEICLLKAALNGREEVSTPPDEGSGTSSSEAESPSLTIRSAPIGA